MEDETKKRVELIRELITATDEDMDDKDLMDALIAQKVSANINAKTKDTTGQRAADAIAGFAGSWAFIFSFIGVMILWIIINTLMATKAFDVYPFILLNLVLSCIAAIQAPMIMMSQNRQEEKDRMRAENDYFVNLKSELVIDDLYRKIDMILANQEEQKTEQKAGHETKRSQ